jgi:tripartite-type tricarboxylate transporter receptor subunit TctC
MKTLVTLGLSLLVACTAAQAQSFATRPIQMIVTFDAGGSVDIIARTMQPRLSASLGQPVVVVNRPGASGTVGAQALAAAKPDGHTIAILAMGATAMVPHLRKLTYDLESFDFLCQVNASPVLVMVSPTSAHRDIRELLAYGKANPAKMFYGSPGIGTPDHINTAYFLRLNGVTGTHVPYQGSGAAAGAMKAGQIELLTNTTVLMRGHQLRPLAVMAAKRLPELPEVPTAAEIGPAAEASIWSVLAAPKGLPANVKRDLEQACRTTLEDAEYRALAERGGFAPVFRDANATKAFVTAEFEKYGPIIRAEGLDRQ